MWLNAGYDDGRVTVLSRFLQPDSTNRLVTVVLGNLMRKREPDERTFTVHV